MTVSEQIIQVLDALCEKFGLVVDWTSANVMPYLTTLSAKLISYEIWTSVAWMVIMAMTTIIIFVLAKKFTPVFKAGRNQSSISKSCDWEFATGAAIFGIIVFCLITLVVLATQTMDIIKCVTFPEMYIIEYIQGLLSSGS